MENLEAGKVVDDQEEYDEEYLYNEFEDQDGMRLVLESSVVSSCLDVTLKDANETQDGMPSFFDSSIAPFGEPSGVAGTSKDPNENKLFFFKAVFYRRLFKGQMKPKQVVLKTIGGNTVQEVFAAIWAVAKNYILRQIVFDDNGPKWSEKQFPDEGDMEEFITVNDPSKKRTYTMSALTPRVITTWRKKEIKIYLHAYSTTVETNVQHQLVLRKLIAPSDPDRAGANSTRDDSSLAKELKETHPDLDGHHSSWLLWANYIHSSDAHVMEQLKTEPAPPLELTKFFRWTNVSESARLQSVHRGVTVASTVNNGWLRDVKELLEGVSSALSILQTVVRKIEAMVQKGTAGDELITAMQAAVRPEESELSQILADKITDCPDIDHA